MNRLAYILAFTISLTLCGKAYSQTALNLGIDISAGLHGFSPHGKRGLGGNIAYIKQLWAHGGIRASAGYWKIHLKYRHEKDSYCSMLVFGNSFTQPAILFREVWLSPFTDVL